MANKILISNKSIEIHCAKGDVDTQTKLVDINPLHFNRSRTIFTCSAHFVPEILHLLRGVTKDNIESAPLKIQEYFNNEMRTRENMQDLLLNGPRMSPYINSNLTLMKHQQLGREIAMYQDRFGFFYDTRTGKTPLSLAIINDDLVTNPTHKWLVICPLILIDNAWLEDATKFVPYISFINCHASTKQNRLKQIAKPGSVYITNTESFAAYRTYFDNINFAGCIFDESSAIKSNSSKVSKEIVDFAAHVPRFYLLSGTPAANGEHEYFMQIRAIDYYGFQQSYEQFKKYYFVNIAYNSRFERLMIRPDREQEFYETLRKYSIFIDKEDVLTTPGRTFLEVELDMPKDLKQHYNLLKNQMYLEVEDEKFITTANAAAKMNKLNQVASGFIIDTGAKKDNKLFKDDESYEKQQEWYILNEFRFHKLAELLSSEKCVGKQVLIWANYRNEFELIKKMLGTNCRLIYGATSLKEKSEAIRLFKEKHIQYLVANPASADKGLTLTNAHIAVYFSLNWSYELFKQSYERIYADISKQPEHCYYYIFIAKGTINRAIYSDVLLGKKHASDAVLNHLKGGNLV